MKDNIIYVNKDGIASTLLSNKERAGIFAIAKILAGLVTQGLAWIGLTTIITMCSSPLLTKAYLWLL